MFRGLDTPSPPCKKEHDYLFIAPSQGVSEGGA